MALPDFNINPYVQPYVGGVQKEVGQLMNQRIQDYDLAAEQYDVLGYQTDTLLQNVAPFEADKLYGQELMGKYRKEVDAAAEKGDYEFMVRDVKRSARQFAAETAPLVARRKAFDDYRKTAQDLYQKGDIDLEMYNAAMQKTIQDNSNIDKEAVKTGSFSGFIPTKRIDISQALDDAIKGMEANGKIGKMQINSDGTYSIVGGEYRTAEDIYKAAVAYLEGSSDYRNYATTLATLGLGNKLMGETAKGLEYVQQKYKFNKPSAQQGFVPKDAWERIWEQMNPTPLTTSVGDVTENKAIQDLYSKTKIKDGQVYGDDKYYTVNSDGTVNKYMYNGKQISVEEYRNAQKALASTGVGDPNLVTQTVTGDELQKVSKIQNEQFNNLVINTFLSENGLDIGNISTSQRSTILNTPTAQAKLNDPKYREQVYNKYQAALKNHQKVETMKWLKADPSSVKALLNVQQGNMANPLSGGFGGRRIGVLNTDAKDMGLSTGYQDGQSDMNTVLQRMKENGWEVKNMVERGLMFYNPLNSAPNSAGATEVEVQAEKDGQVKYIRLAVELDVRDKKPMIAAIQQVGNAHLSGNGGRVPVPGTDKYWNVISVPGYLQGKDGFVSKVFMEDKQGNKLSDGVFIDDFFNSTASHLIREEASPILTNKND